MGSDVDPSVPSKADAPEQILVSSLKLHPDEPADRVEPKPSAEISTDSGQPIRASGQQLAVLLLALLAFYSAPILIAVITIGVGLGGSLAAIFDESSAVTAVLKAMAKDRNQYLGVFHQLLVPVLAAFTALSFDDLRRSRATGWLFVLPLLSLFIAILLAITFRFLTNVSDADKTMVADLFNTMAQNLSVYVLMLIGLEGAHQRRTS